MTPCTPKKTLEVAKESGNDVLVQIKPNQETLLKDCLVTIRNEEPLDVYESPAEKGHGRVETRTARVFSFPFATDPDWEPLIKCIVEIKRKRAKPTPKSQGGGWVDAEETAVFACTKIISARDAERAVRLHWGIENQNHYVRDVSFLEDASRIRNNPGIMARMRSFALNVLKANDVSNIAESLYRNALNFQNLKKLRFL